VNVEVVFHRLAANEARDVDSWYACRSEEVAIRFRAAVIAASAKIASGIDTHPIAATKFRYARLHRFPYRLIYMMATHEVAKVIAVAHHSRRPGYWRRRR